MSLIEYSFYDGEFLTTVDREKQIVTMFERGGWSRSYDLSFKELLEQAKNWGISLNLGDDDETIAKIVTNIILANNAVEHNLNPFRYLPKTNKIIDPREKEIIQKFEELLDTHGLKKVLQAMSSKNRKLLK